MDEQQEQNDGTKPLNDDIRKEIDEYFSMLDKNGNGFIEYDELGKLFSLLGQNYSDDEVKKIIEQAEKESDRKDGKLDKEEFCMLIASDLVKMNSKEEEEAEILDAFRVFDKNGDGFITEDELVKVLSCNDTITVEEARDMIQKMDADNDGRISYPEFVAKMMDS